MASDPATSILVAVIGTTLSCSVWVFLFGGLARIPWRYAAQIALGVTAVLVAASLARGDARLPFDPGVLVLSAAIGAGIAVRAYEKGKARRDAMIEAILRPH